MITAKVSSKKTVEPETETTEHPYQVNLANFEAKAVRQLFGLNNEANSRVGQALYLYAIEAKLKENSDERSAIEYLKSFAPVVK
jgi:hypothetical protein